MFYVNRALIGDRRAFGHLVEKHQEAIRLFFLAQTRGDRMLSDDLAQETFLKAWRSIGSFRVMARFSTWLYRIAYNTWLDHLRARRPAGSIESREVRRQCQPTAPAGLSLDLHRALALLSEAERLCLILQLIEGQSLHDIARITSLPENTVKSHLRRGKKKMVNYLRQNGYE